MKLSIKISVLLVLILSPTGLYANQKYQSDGKTGGVIVPGTITTYTSEPCAFEGKDGGESVSSSSKIPRDLAMRYPCTVSAGNGLVEFISEIYRFMYFTALIFGVAMIVFAGIVLSMSGAAGDGAREKAKKWIPKMLFGIAWLIFIPFILKTMAPYFFQ